MTTRLLQLPASEIRKGDSIALHGVARSLERSGPFDASGNLIKVATVRRERFADPSRAPGGMTDAVLLADGSGSGLWFAPDRLVYAIRKVAP